MTTNFGRSRTGNCTTCNFAHQPRKGVKKVKIGSLINFDHNFWGFNWNLTQFQLFILISDGCSTVVLLVGLGWEWMGLNISKWGFRLKSTLRCQLQGPFLLHIHLGTYTCFHFALISLFLICLLFIVFKNHNQVPKLTLMGKNWGNLTECWPRRWEIVMSEVQQCWLMKQLLTFWVAPLLLDLPTLHDQPKLLMPIEIRLLSVEILKWISKGLWCAECHTLKIISTLIYLISFTNSVAFRIKS